MLKFTGKFASRFEKPLSFRKCFEKIAVPNFDIILKKFNILAFGYILFNTYEPPFCGNFKFRNAEIVG